MGERPQTLNYEAGEPAQRSRQWLWVLFWLFVVIVLAVLADTGMTVYVILKP